MTTNKKLHNNSQPNHKAKLLSAHPIGLQSGCVFPFVTVFDLSSDFSNEYLCVVGSDLFIFFGPNHAPMQAQGVAVAKDLSKVGIFFA